MIEVAETSVPTDRAVKLRRYAQAGIPESWLLDISGDPAAWYLEAHTEPAPDGYRLVRCLARGERITLQALPTVEVSVDELLGPAELD